MLTIIIGDVTKPLGDGKKIIPHICNDIGAWGSGVVIAISKVWPMAELVYKSNYKAGLGSVSFCENGDVIIANMVAQHDLISKQNPKPIRYDSLKICMQTVAEKAREQNASLHCPKFGSMRAGGDWNYILDMIKTLWADLDVTIYEYQEP